ncbi:hypothetical protein N0V83_005751 [Neocucurbitaria cava]|uniref:Uncharacterized protein n=1 Tax=Neocucurbitaria cava TaxID=798079 RepID=A0A9W9CMJ6_9PLEO|nr:hypothetical protein N0V83_005751 [Neocucurbitaria cava]
MLRAENPFPLELPREQRSLYFSKWYDDISSRYRKDIEKRYDTAMSASKAAKQIIDAVEAQSSGKIWDKINGDILHVEMLKAA